MGAMLNWLLPLAIAVFTAYVGLMVLTWLLTDSVLFPAPASSYQDTPDQNKLPSPDGNKITAIFLPNPQASHVLLFGHGNRMDLGLAEERLQAFRDHGWAVFAYEYPGYGTSTGQPSESGCYAALFAAYAYLTALREIPPEKIVLYGLSLGSGPAVDLASREPVGGIILEGAFTSVFRVLTHWKILPWDKFDNFEKIPRVQAPLLVIHAEKDQTVPFWHGQTLFARHHGPKQHLWIPSAHHNNILEMAAADYWAAIEKFRLSLPAADPAGTLDSANPAR
jgi:abhydrolase domain-containing protein 17